jgi:23S rRNA (adenine2503-C2)-methyltransferase
MSTLNDYIEATNKRIFYEYVMLEGVNDHEKEAHELGKLLKGTLAHVNLIPFNSPEKLNEERYKRSRKEVMQSFQAILQIYGVPSTIRVSLGQDIAAACGQLALEEKDF